MKVSWSTLIPIVAILIVALLILRPTRCGDDIVDDILQHGVVDMIKPLFSQPSWWTHQEVKPVHVATINYKTPPLVSAISGGTIYPNGDIELEFQLDSTLFELQRFEIGGYHGRGTLWIDSLGMPRISYPRWGIDIAGVVGPSVRGVTGALEHVYLNNFLGITHIHPFTPLVDVALWDVEPGERPSEVYVGIGATADLAPRRFETARVGIGWEWNAETGDNGPTFFLGLSFP